ncbi:hypothetical protein [Paraburkholderia sp. J67]|uniref:hypothetical protein n=1 Tax=Paraburkholderia sp. J67 TaxID=2805435 RepID=UPI002ABE7026|nr:hypothetical protein [Paraburkholderia sp. J67]
MSREIPDGWIEKLFSKMETIYGGSFRAMWGNVDADEMKATWKQGLGIANVTDEGLRRGVAALFHTKRAPNLPEFIELCAPVPAMYRQNTLALTDERRTPPDEARAQLANIRDIAKGLLREHGAPAGGGIRWAHRILQRAADGEPITPHQIAFAKEAIEIYGRTHGRVNREPGSDDE